jgi:RND family efflux transporter MFP subunit
MKKHFLYLLIIPVLIACGDKEQDVDAIITDGNLTTMRSTKDQLVEQRQQLETQIEQLDNAIEEKTGKKADALVSVYKVQDTLFEHYLELQGNVETKQNIVIRPEANGILTRVYVTEGQRVSKGQLLAKIDDGGLSQQIAQMQVQADLAKTTFERQKRLWDQNIGSEIQFLQAKANYEGQVEAINSMRQQLGKTTVNAPFSGVIDNVITEEGTVVNPGATELFRLVNLSDMYITVDVPENYLPTVNTGTDVMVRFPILGEEFESKIRQTSDFINPSNRTFSIEVPVPNKSGNIKPNLTARLEINDYTSENALLVPLSVISENQDGEQYVMVATDNPEDSSTKIAERQLITTGLTQGDMVEITSGLESGMLIIDAGARTVKEGQEVSIKSRTDV